MNPIAKKLLIKPGTNWLFVNAPKDYLAYIDPLPENVHVIFESSDKVDGLQLFVKNKAELAAELKSIQPTLKPDTILWITYPKKNTKIPTDLAMMDSWDEVKQYGLDTVASAAINDTWTALRFKPKDLVKTSPAKLSEIAQSDLSEYIDVTNKKVTLPPDVLEALKEAPKHWIHSQAWHGRTKRNMPFGYWVPSKKKQEFQGLRKWWRCWLMGRRIRRRSSVPFPSRHCNYAMSDRLTLTSIA